ncbi:hypothetical protein I7I51_07076 [Histoplasma capsulatum]|uniref:Uncharacterized protein n=1 Tax=Ajellomyces capsulatus TaxID=5037 RepID=A0A8A1MJF3_AJECA|nr:hypothetical protein I7I51_07076 [Histoplasma capsulatum]
MRDGQVAPAYGFAIRNRSNWQASWPATKKENQKSKGWDEKRRGEGIASDGERGTSNSKPKCDQEGKERARERESQRGVEHWRIRGARTESDEERDIWRVERTEEKVKKVQHRSQSMLRAAPGEDLGIATDRGGRKEYQMGCGMSVGGGRREEVDVELGVVEVVEGVASCLGMGRAMAGNSGHEKGIHRA